MREATGWSGDGAPGGGTLREFAVGAVIQHFTKDLARRPGIDFRLPTKHELRALLAFQLSIGRAAELRRRSRQFEALIFADRAAERGRALFHGAARAAAAPAPAPNATWVPAPTAPKGWAACSRPGVELLPTAPACRRQGRAPGDGGFGVAPVKVVAARPSAAPAPGST